MIYHASVKTGNRYTIFQSNESTVSQFITKIKELGKELVGEVKQGKYIAGAYHG